RSAEVLERRARATYTGATREPEGGMRELVFALEFRGSAGPVPGVDGRRRARTSATSQVLRTLLRAGDVQATVEPTGEGVAILESEVLSTGEGTFVESGTISYGDAGRVAFRTVGQGVTGASAIEGLRHGAVIWEVMRGEGRLAGAQGLITSNFTVGRDGQVTDNHLVRLRRPQRRRPHLLPQPDGRCPRVVSTAGPVRRADAPRQVSAQRRLPSAGVREPAQRVVLEVLDQGHALGTARRQEDRDQGQRVRGRDPDDERLRPPRTARAQR